MVTISLYKVVNNVSFDEEKGVFSDNVSFGEKRFVECDDMEGHHRIMFWDSIRCCSFKN